MSNTEKIGPRSHLRLVGGTDVERRHGASETPQIADPAPSGVSLMVTLAQKDRLRALGFPEETIRTMTPAEAHAHLGL